MRISRKKARKDSLKWQNSFLQSQLLEFHDQEFPWVWRSPKVTIANHLPGYQEVITEVPPGYRPPPARLMSLVAQCSHYYNDFFARETLGKCPLMQVDTSLIYYRLSFLDIRIKLLFFFGTGNRTRATPSQLMIYSSESLLQCNLDHHAWKNPRTKFPSNAADMKWNNPRFMGSNSAPNLGYSPRGLLLDNIAASSSSNL